MKNSIKKYLCYSTGWLLSVFGIVAGNISCVYGPAFDEEEFHRVRQMETEVKKLEWQVKLIEDEKYRLMKDVVRNDDKIKYLKQERDSLKILLENFEK
jgi:hypothetical protein